MELVVVMSVLGILSVGTFMFIRNANTGYAATLNRSQMAEDARLTLARLVSELRRALPRSVRGSSECLEWVPVLSASSYLSAPVTSAATSIRAWPLDPMPSGANLRVSLYPDSTLYSLASPGPVSPVVTIGAPALDNSVELSFASAHQFVSESPQRKFFVVTEPVSYCFVGERLYRYSGYGYAASQPGPGALPSSLPGRALYADAVSGSFAVNSATRVRNGEVLLDVVFSAGDEQVRMQQRVQVRNAP